MESALPDPVETDPVDPEALCRLLGSRGNEVSRLQARPQLRAFLFFMNLALLVRRSGNCTYFPCFAALPAAQLLPTHLPAKASQGGSEEDELTGREGIQVSPGAKRHPFPPWP